MFRSLFVHTSRTASRVSPSIASVRAFHQTLQTHVTYKKRAAKKTKVYGEFTTEVPPSLDFEAATKRSEAVLLNFNQIANEIKLGRKNPQLFDNLKVELPDEQAPFTSVAQTTIKGWNFYITVFNPSNAKHVINAILASDLNMNPILDIHNKLLLKVPMPPATTESKKETAKTLKVAFEKFKSGPSTSKKHANTLAAIRADVRQQLTLKKKLSHPETVLWDDFEKIHKTYVGKLTDMYKTAETAILK